MANSDMFKINNHSLNGGTYPALKYQGASYSRQAVDSANSGRNQAGDMIRDLITQKDKWRLEFAPMTPAQLHALLNEIDDAFFTFTAPSATTSSATETKTYYVGDRSAAVLHFDTNGNPLWGNVSFDIIER